MGIDSNIKFQQHRIGLIVGMLLLCFSAMAQVSVTREGWITKYAGPRPQKATPILNLLATPERYNNKRVRVLGVLSAEFEDQNLYLNSEYYKAVAAEYAILLQLPRGSESASRELNGKYVYLDGIFSDRETRDGHGIIDVIAVSVVNMDERNVNR
jgi:hypothetical protein